jgi:hypothetical protein
MLSLSLVLRGEGQGEGFFFFHMETPLTPALSPAYRAEGE